MSIQQGVLVRNAQADTITTRVGSAGKLRILSGAKPATAGAAETGTLLAEHTTGTPLAPAAAAGVLSPTLPANVNASATGTAGYWRLYSAGVTECVTQGDVGLSGSDMNLNTLSLVAGGPVQVNSFTITIGGAT